MAKLTPYTEKEIFENKIEDYLKKATIDYSRFFDGRSTFVTYYSRNNISSLYENTLDSAVEIIGSHSPIKYNKIENFVLYQFPNLDLNIDESDMGLITEIDGEAIVPPDTNIEPLVDDYFYLDGLPEKFLFRVNKVSPDKISGNQFYKIEFHLEFYDIDSIEKQVLNTYIKDFDNLNNGILLKSDQLILTDLGYWHNTIIDFAIENFFYEPLNYFYFSNFGLKFYDPLWTMFAIKFNLFIRMNQKEILNSLFLRQIDLGKQFNKIDSKIYYKQSIFNFFETLTCPEKITNLNYIFTGNPKRTNELFYEGENNGIILHIDDNTQNYIFDNNFKTKLINKELYDNNNLYGFENLFINYYNDKINKNNFISYLENLDFDINFKTFISIPLILKILKDLKNKILN